MDLIIAIIAAGAAFLLIDLIWLGFVARDFYRRQMQGLIAERFNVPAAIAFYVVYLVGLTAFAIAPNLASGDIVAAAMRGAAFGFFCYATYDLTNLAVMRDYPTRLAIVDIIWGTVLTASAAAAGVAATTLF